jgi:hypothetical protein
VGRPDFTIMDAIDVGVGNEGFPIYRRLGLAVMGRNPIAVDLVGARLLGLATAEVPYLQRAIERGYRPAGLAEVGIAGDLQSLDDLDQAAKAIQPYDDEFYRWQDVSKELERLHCPIRFFQGPYGDGGELCKTGCVMGLKMFLAAFEYYTGAGPAAFASARPAVIVIGRPEEEIDVRGGDALLFGSCARPKLRNARKVIKIDRCFTTVSDMMIRCGGRLGMPVLTSNPKYILPIVQAMMGAAARKLVKGRYAQDIGYFIAKRLDKRI